MARDGDPNRDARNEGAGENAPRPEGGFGDNTVKDPTEWKSGDEPMTGAQRSYLKTLSDEAKEPFTGELSKAEASKRIDELREQLGR